MGLLEAFHYSCKPVKVTFPPSSIHPCALSNQKYRWEGCISNAGAHCYAVFSLYMQVSVNEYCLNIQHSYWNRVSHDLMCNILPKCRYLVIRRENNVKPRKWYIYCRTVEKR